MSDLTNKRTHIYTDSLGREVCLPEVINKILPAGVSAQNIIGAVCPEKAGGLSLPLSEDDIKVYSDSDMKEFCSLPVTGSLFSRHADTVDVELIKTVNAEFILDVGDIRDNMIKRIDALQDKTKIPVVFLEGTLGKIPNVFEEIGRLSGNTERADELKSWIVNLYNLIEDKRARNTDAVKVLYGRYEKGVATYGGYGYVNQVIQYLGGESVVIPESENNQMDLNRLYEEPFDFVIFNNRSCYDDVMNRTGEAGEIWQNVWQKVRGNFAVAPALINNWLSSPLFVQTIGMAWIGNTIWPQVFDFDLMDLTIDFYHKFFGIILSELRAKELLGIEK